MLDLNSLNPITIVASWSRQSHDVARRNAMVAHSALTARRVERVEAQDSIASFLATRAAARTRSARQAG